MIPVQENPELIVDAHLAFLRAGAEIILSSTYASKKKEKITRDETVVGIDVRENCSNKSGTLRGGYPGHAKISETGRCWEEVVEQH